MNFAASNSSSASPVFIATIIVCVLAGSALFGWLAWRLCKSADRAERDPRYLRRILLSAAMFYAIGAAYGIKGVIAGNTLLPSLVGLIVAAALIWFYIKAASRVKVPPP